MKTTLFQVLSSLWHSPKNHFLTFRLILCVCASASTTQAATAGMVVAWGANFNGQTNVPVAAQSGVTAIAAGWQHTVALIGTGPLLPYLNARPTGNELILS